MGNYGTKEKANSTQPEVGEGYGEPEQRMEPHGNSKGPKHTNHREHDKMLHKMMPTEGDCE